MAKRKRTKVFRADRLRELENEFPGNQDDFAALVGVEQSQMNRYLTGKSEPSPDLIKTMAEKYKVTTDWLLGLTKERQRKLSFDELSPREQRVIEAMRVEDQE